MATNNVAGFGDWLEHAFRGNENHVPWVRDRSGGKDIFRFRFPRGSVSGHIYAATEWRLALSIGGQEETYAFAGLDSSLGVFLDGLITRLDTFASFADGHDDEQFFLGGIIYRLGRLAQNADWIIDGVYYCSALAARGAGQSLEKLIATLPEKTSGASLERRDYLIDLLARVRRGREEPPPRG